ncbi:ABC-2 transporter permease [Massilia sp. R2A-15]|uniref:ABC-2 transporter permease n=1 Tax=Massilia sp. R2A-15 TaxID=3064278 RepID=UPI002734E594|nr:ABC-2 transporter permease [Massilia sp. R2A-15]WLI90702.1 ABC-2 transporter permease [Massilia sp. R2A-15]
MNTMKWLLRREYWEHKGGFFWAPAIIAVVMLAVLGGTIAYGSLTHGLGTSTVIVNGHVVSQAHVISALPLHVREQIANSVANSYLAAAAPLFAVLPFVAFFYCLAALYDDRRDRSILFWKSLPVSDQETVLSKVLTALCVAPLITIAIGTATALISVLIGLMVADANGLRLFGLVLSNPEFWLAPFRLVALLPVYVLWAIPTVGWLLMVSAWARSKVFLWAVGIPLLGLMLARWINFMTSSYLDTQIDVHWIAINIVMRALAGVVPGLWLPFGQVDPHALLNSSERGVDAAGVFTQSWMTLTQPQVWIGVVVGAAMIFAAMRLRRWRDEG